eukprot:Platyproteum_vivax@DN15581_c0_g1_i1.p1
MKPSKKERQDLLEKVKTVWNLQFSGITDKSFEMLGPSVKFEDPVVGTCDKNELIGFFLFLQKILKLESNQMTVSHFENGIMVEYENKATILSLSFSYDGYLWLELDGNEIVNIVDAPKRKPLLEPMKSFPLFSYARHAMGQLAFL